MKQHGRKSEASLDLDLSNIGDPVAVLRPPPYLSATEAKLFVEVVANVPSGQFSASDVYLLTSFVRITLLCNEATKALAKANDKTRSQRVKILEQMVKMQALLATKLRLTTTSRTSAHTTGRLHSKHRPSAYDLMDTRGFEKEFFEDGWGK